MGKAKILATLGPATNTVEVISQLIEAGADAFRLNFSHGTHDEHRAIFNTVRQCASEAGIHIPIIQDLQGPKIRVDLEGRKPLNLHPNSTIYLTAESAGAAPDTVRVAYPPLCGDVQTGDPILLDDGKIVLKALGIENGRVKCTIRIGGLLRNRKGMNLPGTKTSLSPITEKDKADLKVGLDLGVDYVALSFVQCADDIKLLRNEMDRLGKSAPIIAKLERPAAVVNIDEILEVTDAVMVARGDLGIEINVERLPVVQKRLIEAANGRGIPVITATQMLDSMTENITPTRAEVTDVANALYDGSDVVMLSGETSVGSFPVDAVRMMSNIIDEAEAFPQGYTRAFKALNWDSPEDDGTTTHLAVQAAKNMDVKAVCACTQSGRTATLISKFRPEVPTYAFSPDAQIVNRMGLLWGTTPVLMPLFEDSDTLVSAINDYVVEHELADKGDLIAIVFGAPIADKCPSNMLRLHTVS